MKLNNKKCKFMIFNPTIVYDFLPEMEIEGNHLETLDEMKLLGLTLTSDLKWKTNTTNMVKKSYSKMWILKRLKKKGANLQDLTDIYNKQVRSVLEFGAPVWNV